jgi:hypothetical protein
VSVVRARKRPIEVEAMLYDGTVEAQSAIVTWSRGRVEGMFGGSFHEKARYYLQVPTLHGLSEADAGDWVIRGPSGDYWPCKPDIFEQFYEVIA